MKNILLFIAFTVSFISSRAGGLELGTRFWNKDLLIYNGDIIRGDRTELFNMCASATPAQIDDPHVAILRNTQDGTISIFVHIRDGNSTAWKLLTFNMQGISPTITPRQGGGYTIKWGDMLDAHIIE